MDVKLWAGARSTLSQLSMTGHRINLNVQWLPTVAAGNWDIKAYA